MQIRQITESIPVLQELMSMKNISFNAGFKLQKITNEIDIVAERYGKARQELLDKYGVVSEDKTQYTFEDDKREKYDVKIKAILDEEIEISFKKLPIDLFKNIEIEPGKVRVIAWLFKD